MQQSDKWLNKESSLFSNAVQPVQFYTIPNDILEKATTSKLCTSYSGRLQKIDASDSSDRIMLNQNDSVLSMHNPTYKAVMFDQFCILGPTRDLEKESNISNELFLMLKDGGGRFFKAYYANKHQSSIKCYEVNEEEALESKLAFEENIWKYYSVRELMIIILSVF